MLQVFYVVNVTFAVRVMSPMMSSGEQATYGGPCSSVRDAGAVPADRVCKVVLLMSGHNEPVFFGKRAKFVEIHVISASLIT